MNEAIANKLAGEISAQLSLKTSVDAVWNSANEGLSSFSGYQHVSQTSYFR